MTPDYSRLEPAPTKITPQQRKVLMGLRKWSVACLGVVGVTVLATYPTEHSVEGMKWIAGIVAGYFGVNWASKGDKP